MTRILIVEDEKLLNDAYSLILKKDGYEVASAFNGEEALKICEEQDNFDLILLDLRMPKMDGVSFLKKVNLSASTPKTKIIIFSNYDDQKEVDEAVKYGASRYILKAWSSPSELLKIVRESLADNA
jgi:CheY-like chemotaxis protein